MTKFVVKWDSGADFRPFFVKEIMTAVFIMWLQGSLFDWLRRIEFPSYLTVTRRRHSQSQIWPSVTDIECIVFLGGELIAHWPKGTFLTQEHCLKHKPPLYLVDSLHLQTSASKCSFFKCELAQYYFFTSVGTPSFSICMHGHSSYHGIEMIGLEAAFNCPFIYFIDIPSGGLCQEGSVWTFNHLSCMNTYFSIWIIHIWKLK